MRKILLALLLFSFIAFAQSCLVTTADILGDQATLLYVLIAISVLGITIAYVFGTGFHNAQLSMLAKDEAYHLAISIALLVTFASLVGFSCLLSTELIDLSRSNFPVTGTCYSSAFGPVDNAISCTKTLQAKTASMISFYVDGQIKMTMDSGWAYTAGAILEGTFTTMMEAYKKVYAMQLETLSNTYAIPALVSISIQSLMLQFTKEFVIKFILPAAFLLRFFPPTRNSGNLLIALCIAFYALLPFFVNFSFLMYDSISLADCTSYQGILEDKPINTELGAPVCDSTGFGVSLWDVGKILPMAFFLPNLSIALIVTFMSAINKALRAFA
ncbi:MAG: hypothetical protein V1492_01970 [Candidatus Micrarchaeota archaeon]